MQPGTPLPVPSHDPRVHPRAYMMGFVRWLEKHTDVFDPVMISAQRDLGDPPGLPGEDLVALAREYEAVAEPLMVCLGCGHHAADHRWTPPPDCLIAGCGCASVL